MSEYLYRYFAVNKWPDDKEWITRLLINREIRYTDINNINDPFDCKLLVNMNNANKEQLNRFYEKHLKNTPGAPALNEFVNNPIMRNFYGSEMAQSIRFNTLFRILCLSGKCDDILMWSHYADKHHGMVVGLDKNKLKPPMLLPIDYDDNFLSLEEFLDIMDSNANPLEANKSAIKVFTRKALLWKHENEYRMFSSYEDEYETLPKEAITEVIFGWEMQEERRRYIIDLVAQSNQNIAMKQAVLDPEYYHLRIIKYATYKNIASAKEKSQSLYQEFKQTHEKNT